MGVIFINNSGQRLEALSCKKKKKDVNGEKLSKEDGGGGKKKSSVRASRKGRSVLVLWPFFFSQKVTRGKVRSSFFFRATDEGEATATSQRKQKSNKQTKKKK